MRISGSFFSNMIQVRLLTNLPCRLYQIFFSVLILTNHREEK
jgi:hypothetical protein